MVEKRKHPRKRLSGDFLLWERNSRTFLGRVANISAEGIMLVSGVAVELGGILQCTLILPEEINGRKELAFDVQSLWCNPSDDPELYSVGLQLLDVPAKDLAVIELLVQESILED